ncbi:hypothetical protein [Fusobacterium sp.]|uniref:DUF7662 domain-containing protein n=1 Tax=Fusobacterium sp. TaxID=68766 RepID=UPI00262A1AAD|nr:hypothetical protein [Fusobacterium sp.]
MIKIRKFQKFYDFLLENKKEKLELKYEDIEKIIYPEKLESSAYNHIAYFSNSKSHPISKIWLELGYKKTKLELGKYIILEKENFNINNKEVFMTNTEKGNDFEKIAKQLLEEYLKEKLEKQKKVEIGFKVKKEHKFDLGNDNYLIECKSYKWTKENNIPSAKISTLRETLYYFFLAPKNYKKILILEKSNLKNNETILDYFLRLNLHLIPEELILLEIDIENKKIIQKTIKS